MTGSAEWSSDGYRYLKAGDVFEIEGRTNRTYTVHSTKRIPGGGIGMGEYPGRNLITLTDGRAFDIDDWLTHQYLPVRVVSSVELRESTGFVDHLPDPEPAVRF